MQFKLSLYRQIDFLLRPFFLISLLVLVLLSVGCNQGLEVTPEYGTLVVYSGRGEELVGPVIDQFSELTGIDVQVRWGKTAELAATIFEEQANTPADVFYGQDSGALDVLQDRFMELPADILALTEPQFRSADRKWMGISGRARTVVYNTDRLQETDLPESIWGFTDPDWDNRIGWAPTNASFQMMITGMRTLWGEEKTRQWLEGVKANNPVVYPKNTPIVQAVGTGEIDVGFVNHYYLLRFLQEEGEAFAARNYHPKNGDPGSLIMVSGVGVLSTSKNQEAAFSLVEFLLSDIAQQYFASQTFEYPLVEGVKTHRSLVPLSEFEVPSIDAGGLSDLAGTLKLLQAEGIL